VLGGFATPWAEDANGNYVPTSYRIAGNALIQSVEFGTNMVGSCGPALIMWLA
jgi:hypothetical protein